MNTLQVMANPFEPLSAQKFQAMTFESMAENELKRFLVEGENSIDQTKNILNRLVDKNCCSSNGMSDADNAEISYQIIAEACTCMNEELNRCITKLKSDRSKKLDENEARKQISFAEHAIHRQQCLLSIVDDMTRKDSFIPVSSIVAMMNTIIEQIRITDQAQTDMNEIEPKATLSSSPKSPILFFSGAKRKLEFDMLVARPEILCCSELPSCFKTSCNLNSGLASAANVPSGKIELPFCLELRTNTSVYYRDSRSSSETDKCTNMHQLTQHVTKPQEPRAFHVEIHRCVHVALDKSPELDSKKSATVGELTLLLSLSAIKSSNTGYDSKNDKFCRNAQGIIKRARA